MLDHAYEQHRERRTISIWLSTTDVFTAGAILADISIRRKLSSQRQDNLVPLRAWNRCTSLLSSYVEAWSSAQVYRDVFEKLLEVVLED